jgi:hypothetical protein
MYWDYVNHLAAALSLLAFAFRCVQYGRTKEKATLVLGLIYLACAALFLLLGEQNRKMHTRDAENALRTQRLQAKAKISVREHSPEAVTTFVSDLHDGKLAKSIARVSEDYRVAWQEYVRSCTDLADEVKALGPAAPDISSWVNSDELPPTANLPDQLRRKLQAVQDADKALEALDRQNQL